MIMTMTHKIVITWRIRSRNSYDEGTLNNSSEGIGSHHPNLKGLIEIKIDVIIGGSTFKRDNILGCKAYAQAIIGKHPKLKVTNK